MSKKPAKESSNPSQGGRRYSNPPEYTDHHPDHQNYHQYVLWPHPVAYSAEQEQAVALAAAAAAQGGYPESPPSYPVPGTLPHTPTPPPYHRPAQPMPRPYSALTAPKAPFPLPPLLPSQTPDLTTLSLDAFRTVLLDDLQSTSRPDVVFFALQKLIHHCRQDADQLVEAVRMGAHSLLLVTWKRWLPRQCEQIVMECSRFMLDLVANPHFHVLRVSLVKMGAMDVIVASLLQFPDSHGLHRHGFRILAHLLQRSNTATRSDNPRVVAIRNRDDEMVQREVHIYCRVGPGEESGEKKADLCVLVLNAMMRFEAHARIQVAACGLLMALWDRCETVRSVLLPRLQELGAAMVVGTALEMHPQSEAVQREGFEIIKLLAPRDSDRQDRMER